MFTFTQHTGMVHCVSFSPCGKYLAAGGFDKVVNVWSVETETVARRYKCDGGVFSISWSSDSTSLAAGCNDSSVVVCDLAM